MSKLNVENFYRNSRINTSDMRIAILVFFVPTGLLLLSTLVMNSGVMIYTLDDPYIHMKMARNIWNGHYGINLHEYSAPSSSIIWPFLLAPFSYLGSVFFYVPLALNAVFAFLTFLLIFNLLKSLGCKYAALITFAIFCSFNLYGLVYNGMEHSLQVALTAFIAASIVRREYLQEEKITNFTYFAIFLLPLVRYEGLAVSLPTLIYLLINVERKKPLFCAIAILLALVSFSFFLNSLGLGWLPSSVLAKSDINDMASLGLHVLTQYGQWGWVVYTVLMVCAFFAGNKSVIWLLLSVTLLHMVFGKSGWYGRYEIYWLVFVAMLILAICSTQLVGRGMVLVFSCLPVAFTGLVYVTLSTPWASANIYNQQYMMSMIVGRLNEAVAVNDLGLVSLATDNYILDLAGLASYEALLLRRKQKDSLWIGGLMKQHNVKYAFIYEEWFAGRPANFLKVAILKLAVPNITSAESSVSLYAVDSASADKLKVVLAEFRKAYPSRQFELIYVQ